jgi:hypothetical protein
MEFARQLSAKKSTKKSELVRQLSVKKPTKKLDQLRNAAIQHCIQGDLMSLRKSRPICSQTKFL